VRRALTPRVTDGQWPRQPRKADEGAGEQNVATCSSNIYIKSSGRTVKLAHQEGRTSSSRSDTTCPKNAQLGRWGRMMDPGCTKVSIDSDVMTASWARVPVKPGGTRGVFVLAPRDERARMRENCWNLGACRLAVRASQRPQFTHWAQLRGHHYSSWGPEAAVGACCTPVCRAIAAALLKRTP
jgi:hypothetical protein